MNNDYVTLAVVNTSNQCISLVEFPAWKVQPGNVVYFVDGKYRIFGAVEITVECTRGDSVYSAMQALYGRKPVPGSAVYTMMYASGGEDNGN